MELDPKQDPFSREAIQHLVVRYGSPLLVIDAERVRQQYRRLRAALPGVDLHYALKPLPHSSLITTLMAAGAFFDLATNGEVELVRRSGVPPERCIHTHPIKRDSDIRTALSFGVTRFVDDNPDELRKFVPVRTRWSLVIGVSFRSPDAVVDLSRKFGCDPTAATDLFRLAAQLRIKIDGVSFHTGSQNADSAMIVRAIDSCRELLDALAAAGHSPQILDIGGGFPVAYLRPALPIEEFCAPIRAALEKLPANVRIIAEPGRYIAAPAAIAVASVIGRALRDDRWWYYLDEGLFCSYSAQMYDHSVFPVDALRSGPETFPSVLAWPTCDSIDVVREKLDVPKLEIGDLVVGRVMGAYTWASASEFNFFPKATVLALDQGRLLQDGASA